MSAFDQCAAATDWPERTAARDGESLSLPLERRRAHNALGREYKLLMTQFCCGSSSMILSSWFNSYIFPGALLAKFTTELFNKK